MRRFFGALLAMATTQAIAQDSDLVQGTVYSCVKDGIRHYKTQPLEGAECKEVGYSYKRSLEVSPDWVPMAESDGLVTYYRKKDVARSGDTVTFWMLDDFEADQFQFGKAYASSIGRMVVGCMDKTYYPSQTTYYAGRFGKGQVVGTWAQRGKPEPLFATPNSIGEIMVDTVCGISRKKSE